MSVVAQKNQVGYILVCNVKVKISLLPQHYQNIYCAASHSSLCKMFNPKILLRLPGTAINLNETECQGKSDPFET